MKVYEIEALRQASKYLFGIELTPKTTKKIIEIVRSQLEDFRGVYYNLEEDVYDYRHSLLSISSANGFNSILPDYIKTGLNTTILGSGGKQAHRFHTSVKQRDSIKRFDGVYSCGDYLFTSYNTITYIQDYVKALEKEKLEKAIASIKNDATIHLKEYQENWAKSTYTFTNPATEFWRENLKKTQK